MGTSRSPLTVALDESDDAAVLAALHTKASVTPNGCWLWGNLDRHGYGKVNYRGRVLGTHRVAMRASLGKDIGSEPVHHKCGVPACCNPEHLTLVTQRENAAEMHERRFYTTRIATLEAALREIDPTHPLL